MAGHPWTLRNDTGCFVWTGSLGRGGRPVVYRDHQQTTASRDRWISIYGPIPRALQLRRVCPFADCVSPYHHVLRSPEAALSRLGANSLLAKAVRALIVARAGADRSFGINWTGPLPSLACDPSEVDRLATDLRCDPLVIHAAYAQLLARDGVRVRSVPDMPSLSADSLARAEKLLDELNHSV